MTRKEKKVENCKSLLIEKLKLHGIKLKIDGCGCCGSPSIKFEYNGDLIFEETDNVKFNMFEEKP